MVRITIHENQTVIFHTDHGDLRVRLSDLESQKAQLIVENSEELGLVGIAPSAGPSQETIKEVVHPFYYNM